MDEIVDAFSARLVAKRRPSFKSFMVVLPYIRGDLPYNEDGPVAPITYILSRLSLNGSVQRTCEEDETMTPPESETHPAAEAINEKPNAFPQMREPVVQKHNPVTPSVVVYSSPVCANETQPIFHPGEQQQAEAPNESATQQSGYQDHTVEEMNGQGVFPNGHWQPATGAADFVTHPDVSSMLWITTPSTVEQPGAPSGDPYPPQYGFPFTSENIPQQAPVPGLNEVVDVSTGLSPYPNGGLAPPITTHSGMFSLSAIDPQLSGISGPDAMPQESMPLTCDIPQPGVTYSATQQGGYQHYTAQEMDEQGVIFPNGHWQPATGTAGFVTHPVVSSTLWITPPAQQPGAPSGDPYPPQYGFPFTSENIPQQAPVPGLNEVMDVSTGLSPYPNGGLAPPITTHSGMFSLSAIDPQLSGISGPDPMPEESMPLTCDIPQPGITYSATQQGGYYTAQEMDEQGVIFPNGHWQPATGTAGFVTHPDVSSTLWITAPSMAQQPGAPSGDPYPPQYGFPFTSENVPQQAPEPGLNEVVDVSTGLSPYPNGGLAPPITSHSGTFPLSVIDPQLLAISGLNPMPQESMSEDPPDSHDRPMRPLPRRGVPQSQAGPPTSVCDNIGTREFCLALKKYQETTDNKYSATSCETLLQMFQQYSLLNSAPFVFAAWACETQPLGDDPTRLEFTLRDLESPQDDPVRLTFQQILLVIKFICGTLPLYQINVTSLDTP
ncbi:hypothetical protein BU17DRAFT_103984 [Hysterangium stoloniferum]|nr:hypothetical protein BU17DRAFT_103984 [Hysterangium stoloniferum]